MKNLFFYSIWAFLSGAIPTAYWTAKRLKGIDIRRHGSGNAGATNVMRVLGKGPGYFVFLVDFLKGLLPVLFYRWSGDSPSTSYLLCVGAAAVLGHVFTPWLGFKGGKGVATGAGMLAAAVPVNFMIALVSWVILYSVTRTVSLSSLIAAFDLALSGIFLKQDVPVLVILFALFLFVAWTHRSNIQRLAKGQEKSFR